LRVKICGITSTEDATAAAQAGADAIGLNLVGGRRQLELSQAREILASLPPMLTAVVLVRLENGRVPDEILELLGEFWVSHLQLYGQVSAESLDILLQDGFRPMPVVAVKDASFAQQARRSVAHGLGSITHRPAAVVLDTFDAAKEGGTGKVFRWEWVTAARQAGELTDWPPTILAGGLNPDNVVEAIRAVQPYAVDVSSGVEVANVAGKKDADKMRAFVHNAKHAMER